MSTYWADPNASIEDKIKWLEGVREKLLDRIGQLMGLIHKQESRIADLEAQMDAVVEMLDDVVWQACYDPSENRLDSMALTAYANAMRLLAENGVLTITQDRGRRVIALRGPLPELVQKLTGIAPPQETEPQP